MADNAELVRSAFGAFVRGDLQQLRATVDANLEWTYLDPSLENPMPATCFGIEELERAAERWSKLGLASELEEVSVRNDKVIVVQHAPGLDRVRSRAGDDKSFYVVTVRGGIVVAIRACRDRNEARVLAGFKLNDSDAAD